MCVCASPFSNNVAFAPVCMFKATVGYCCKVAEYCISLCYVNVNINKLMS